MYIKSIKLHNFKSFSTNDSKDTEINFSSCVNYLVGNNNVGKTTILNSIDFLISGGKKEAFISKNHENEDVSVTVILNDVKPFEKSLKKYNSYIKDSQLKLQRSSKEETIKQGEKEKTVKLDIKKVRVFNYDKGQFENPTGFSNAISELIDPQIIYADLHNEEYQDFRTTKLIGKLLQIITEPFKDTKEFSNLKKAHKVAFGSKGIMKYLSKTQNDLNTILKNQFGDSEMEFKFDFPNVNDLLKRGNILCTENDVKTDISEKGNGLQRAFALAIIQVYSKYNTKDENTQYLIDEPEIYLHPKAQDKLIDSLKKLSIEGNQIFITTHSPYILRHYREGKDSIIIFSLNKNNKEISYVNSLLFFPTSIGEVTYRAFGVPTIDFHQLLFTKLYIFWCENQNPSKKTLAKFDETFLQPKCEEQGLNSESFTPRIRGEWKNEEQRSLPYKVRNEIDHPETLECKDKNNWTEENLKKSIEVLFEIYKKEIS